MLATSSAYDPDPDLLDPQHFGFLDPDLDLVFSELISTSYAFEKVYYI